MRKNIRNINFKKEISKLSNALPNFLRGDKEYFWCKYLGVNKMNLIESMACRIVVIEDKLFQKHRSNDNSNIIIKEKVQIYNSKFSLANLWNPSEESFMEKITPEDLPILKEIFMLQGGDIIEETRRDMNVENIENKTFFVTRKEHSPEVSDTLLSFRELKTLKRDIKEIVKNSLKEEAKSKEEELVEKKIQETIERLRADN